MADSPAAASDRIKAIALKNGAGSCGILPAEELKEYDRFSAVSKNVPPGLGYLTRDAFVREDIRNWFASARSVLVCAFQYWHSGLDHTAISKKAGTPESYLMATGRKVRQGAADGGRKISRYALVPDYHKVLRKKLKGMLAEIKAAYPEADGKIFVDTSPVMEKELARLAGLGFRGRNTLIISKELGSYFFIGGIALTLETVPACAPAEPGCGGCRLCVSACPTGALAVTGALDPALCISYWTTQSAEPMPEELAAKNGGFVYGCDLCQEACPFNRGTDDKIPEEFT